MLLFRWKKRFSVIVSIVLLLSLAAPIGSNNVSAEQGGDRTLSGMDIAAGANHSLLLKSDGTVVAWGDNSKGQIEVPTGLKDVTAIAAGDQHSLALKSNGTVVGWGSNDSNQIDIPAELATGGVVAIAAGRAHSVAIKGNGEIVVWGDNAYSQQTVPGVYRYKEIAANANHSIAIDRGGTVVAWGEHADVMLAVPAGLKDVIAIQSGDLHSLALTANGEVEGWGDNGKGQGTVPVGLKNVIAIAAGGDYSLALKSDGTLAGWGENDSAGTPIPLGLTGIKAISVGNDHALALKSDGSVVAWGDNSKDQLNVPTGIKTPTRAVQLAAGYDHALALKSDGTLIGWGNNDNGQSSIPAELASGGVKAIAAGYQYSIALKDDGHLVVWGNSGAPNYDITTLPVEVDHGGIIAIAAGAYHALALKDDGTVVAWGNNEDGQTDLPDQVQESSTIAIAAGERHSIVLSSVGRVRAWGKNNDSQTSVPSVISSGGVVSISSGDRHSFAIEGSGSVQSWGDNYWGQITRPLELGLKNVVSLVGGHCYSAALFDDGTVHAWGCSDEGQTNVPSGLSGVAALYGASNYTLALKSDGTITGWGINSSNVLDIPETAALSNLLLQEGSFTQAFSPSVTAYTYYYDGHSLTDVHVIAEMDTISAVPSELYINNQLVASGSPVAIDLTGVTTNTVIPIRVDSPLLPSENYTITLELDSTPPAAAFATNGNSLASATAATKVTASDTQSGVDQSSLQYVWTQSTDLPGSGWSSFNNEEILSHSSGSGTWYLHIKAQDRVGNVVHAVSNPFVLTNTSTPSTPSAPSTVSLSNNAQLASLKVIGGTQELALSPIFAAATVEYNSKTTADRVMLEIAAAHPKAIIKHAGQVITSPVQVDLALGNNVYAIDVYAEDGTMKPYSVNIVKEVESKPVCLFTDITNHWARADICEAAELGIVKGVSELLFAPNRDVTRTELTVMLVRLLGLTSQEESGLAQFSDYAHIPQEAQAEMNTAILAGIIEGYPNGQLLPLKEVTRAEMAKLIVNAMQWEPAGTEELAFDDTQQIPSWAKSYVNTAYQHGVIYGRSGNVFVPGGNTTRAEAAVMLLRLWKSQQD